MGYFQINPTANVLVLSSSTCSSKCLSLLQSLYSLILPITVHFDHLSIPTTPEISATHHTLSAVVVLQSLRAFSGILMHVSLVREAITTTHIRWIGKHNHARTVGENRTTVMTMPNIAMGIATRAKTSCLVHAGSGRADWSVGLGDGRGAAGTARMQAKSTSCNGTSVIVDGLRTICE